MSGGDLALRGEMGSVAAAARRISSLDGMNEAMIHLRAGVEQVQAAGNAQALTSLIAVCRPIESRMQQIAALRMQAGEALTRHANEVSALQLEVRGLQRRKAEVLEHRQTTARRLDGVDPSDPEAARQQYQLGGQLDEIDANLRWLEQRLQDCDDARRAYDQRCIGALDACTAAMNALAQQADAPGGYGAGIVRTAVQLKRGAALDPDAFALRLLPAETVAKWWEGLTPLERRNWIRSEPLTIGNLDGIPFEDRIAANAETAKRYLREDGLDPAERGYWEDVVEGRVKLVVLDRDQGRIVEMLGDIDADTSRVITYVPGTTASLPDFYSRSVKEVPEYLADQVPGSVVFVYKDFKSIGWASNLDEDGMAARGARLAEFDRDAIGTDPLLADLEQVAIGYSAAMTVIGGAEQAGAHFDTIISIGGSYLPDDWQPQPGTDYYDIRYEGDFLNNLDEEPLRLDGLNTVNRNPDIFTPIRPQSPDPHENRFDQHGRLGKGPAENSPVLDEIEHILKG